MPTQRVGSRSVLLFAILLLGACGNATEPVIEPGVNPAFDPDAYYVLQTIFSREVDQCFQGNVLDSASTLSGAAFMEACQKVAGQEWKFIPREGGGYWLQTRLGEAESKCLEGNDRGLGSTLQGAAFMDDCSSSPGQLWSVVADDEDTFRLKNGFSGPARCLEGNRVTAGATLGGAALMRDCLYESGQFWSATGS